MNLRVLVILLMVLAGCHHNPAPKIVAPATRPAEPISVTVSRGDFIVVGKQEHGIAVYVTIDRRERSCLVEVQNATDAKILVLDSWSDLSIYRGVGFVNVTSENATSQPHVPTPVTMLTLMPSQVVRGSLELPLSPSHQQIRLRLYYEDPNLTKWLEIESPEFDLAP